MNIPIPYLFRNKKFINIENKKKEIKTRDITIIKNKKHLNIILIWFNLMALLI